MVREARILNRTLRFVPNQGIKYEADARHAEILINELARHLAPLSTPYCKVIAEGRKTDSKEDKEDAIRKAKKGNSPGHWRNHLCPWGSSMGRGPHSIGRTWPGPTTSPRTELIFYMP